MSLTNSKTEFDKILKWARENYTFSDDYDFNKKEDTYFKSFDNTNNIHEFFFNSLPDITEKLNILWENDNEKKEIAKVCAIAIMKGKPKLECEESKSQDSALEIPDYIYVF